MKIIKNTTISFLILFLILFSSIQIISCKSKDDDPPQLEDFVKIAHAGGEIDDIKYTNSLEALENSYNMGFRFFELDIRLTSDKKFVAVHDWNKWQNMTNFSGEVNDENPPTLEVFESYKLFEKYTALTMEWINIWFGDHNDAILVTDKNQELNKFSDEFLFNDRLLMEALNEETIDNSKDSSKLMVNYNGVLRSKSDQISFLNSKKMKYVVTGIPENNTHKKSLKKLIKNGAFVFMYFLDKDGDISKQIAENRSYYNGAYVDYYRI
ncbi:glycerophosphodiester phosphodiesterase family protein [Spiroplasma endosymbiont of Othius punctulatus]|uniref:glycerophosphodiester phosphodiesterase family protein n=1 Tax=Spiroplasma endosymbiont of Othius punctulatus TaxID=3066289 RepID=UPI0030D4010D